MDRKWLSTTTSRLRRGLTRIDWEAIIGVSILILMLVLVLTVFAMGVSRAGSCLTMDVAPHQVLGNYDGDTFTVSLGALGNMIVRVEGVDTPERNKKQPGWQEAKAFTAKWLAKGPFKLNTCFALTLGRVVGSPSRDGRTLAQDLIDAGMTKGSPRE